MSDEPEVSESGAPIWRYEGRERGYEPATGDAEAIHQISEHITRHIGPIQTVFHEIVSDLVHVDVHYVGPQPGRPYHTLVTSGMSDLAMTTPHGAEGCRYAELMLCLPGTWPLTMEAFRDEANYWPVRWLKQLARFPHEYDTWLWWGHSMPNGDPPTPFAPSTRLCGVLLSTPVLAPPEFGRLAIDHDGDDEKLIHFFSLLPVYREEMDFKLKHGAQALLDRLDRSGVSERLDIGRKNACAKSLWPF